MSAPTAQAQISRAQALAAMPQREREMFFLSLSPKEAEALRWDWEFWGRPAQLEPLGDWSIWLALAGRGFGKTRLGAEWVRSMVCGRTPTEPGIARRIALVAETAADCRDVMVRGVSGILAVHPPAFRPRYVPSLRTLEWPNGAVAFTYSAEEPDQLRGPEHDLAWVDELAKWRHAQETWDMLQFGLRLGENPKQLVTTTPRPIALIREILLGEKSGDTVVTRGSTYDNFGNLATKFVNNVRKKYEGSRLGRQELHAEILDDVPGAMWTRDMFEVRSPYAPKAAGMRLDEPLPRMIRIAVAIDPSGTSGEEDDTGDDVGIIVAGLGDDDQGYILEDATCSLGPAGWAKRAIEMYNKWDADVIVGEKNFGGAMVEHTIRSVSRRVNYKSVTASRGKTIRAEPVAALYEQGRVRHYGAKAGLEDQMCSMATTGYVGNSNIGKSPDRLDAAVWAITELMLGKNASQGVEAEAEGGY